MFVCQGHGISNSPIICSWKKRFFVLNGNDGQMQYYKQELDYRIGLKPLSDHKVKYVTHWPEKNNGLEVITRGGKVFFMYAQTQGLQGCFFNKINNDLNSRQRSFYAHIQNDVCRICPTKYRKK
jgi:hypothetical protein